MLTAVIISMRLMGKRQIGELELSELATAIMISEMATMPIADSSLSIWHGITPVATLVVSELLIAFLSMKSIKFRKLASGAPSIIVQDGKISQKQLRKNRLTLDELTEGLRSQSVTDISTVKYAILETNGTLSILLYDAHTPVTHSAMNIPPNDKGLATFVINDGRVLSHNLKILGLNEKWLEKELERRNVKSPKDVFVMCVDEQKNIYFAAKE